MLLLVVGVLVAIGVPAIWTSTHQDPALVPVGQGMAIRLAQGDSAPASAVGAGPRVGGVSPTSGRGTLTTVPFARSSTSAMPRASSGPVTTVTARPTSAGGSTAVGPRTRSGPSVVLRSPSMVRPNAAPHTAPLTSVKPLPGSGTHPPVRLQIPRIGVDAPVDPVGLDARGDLAVPYQVQTIGWYQFGPAPGSVKGSAVLSGHVDSAQQGLGAFARLGDLQAGDLITVSDATGRRILYRVAAKEAFDKSDVPMAQLFSRAGAARLTLITCGGDFDSAARSYVDNIVVTAVPA